MVRKGVGREGVSCKAEEDMGLLYKVGGSPLSLLWPH